MLRVIYNANDRNVFAFELNKECCTIHIIEPYYQSCHSLLNAYRQPEIVCSSDKYSCIKYLL